MIRNLSLFLFDHFTYVFHQFFFTYFSNTSIIGICFTPSGFRQFSSFFSEHFVCCAFKFQLIFPYRCLFTNFFFLLFQSHLHMLSRNVFFIKRKRLFMVFQLNSSLIDSATFSFYSISNYFFQNLM